jgi:hypothetical protein
MKGKGHIHQQQHAEAEAALHEAVAAALTPHSSAALTPHSSANGQVLGDFWSTKWTRDLGSSLRQ